MTLSNAFWKSMKQAYNLPSYVLQYLFIRHLTIKQWSEVLACFVNPTWEGCIKLCSVKKLSNLVFITLLKTLPKLLVIVIPW